MCDDITLASLRSLYKGFSLEAPVGNNAFSYDLRRQKSLYVAPLISADINTLAVGSKVAFSEVVDGREMNFKGLKSFVHTRYQGRDVFIFDNHNHAFFFWYVGFRARQFPAGTSLVHVDQHKDTRHPDTSLPAGAITRLTLGEVFQYTNNNLNVGNFIQPALQTNLFSRMIILDHLAAFTQNLPAEFVLDIDMDIFSPDMRYIDDALKMERLRNYLKQASFVTIATSPFFMDQEDAISKIRMLFQ